MVVMDIASTAFPVTRCSTGCSHSTAPPNTHQDTGGASSNRCATDTDRSPGTNSHRPTRNRARAAAGRGTREAQEAARRCESRTKSAHALRAQVRAATLRVTVLEVLVSCRGWSATLKPEYAWVGSPAVGRASAPGRAASRSSLAAVFRPLARAEPSYRCSVRSRLVRGMFIGRECIRSDSRSTGGGHMPDLIRTLRFFKRLS